MSLVSITSWSRSNSSSFQIRDSPGAYRSVFSGCRGVWFVGTFMSSGRKSKSGFESVPSIASASLFSAFVKSGIVLIEKSRPALVLSQFSVMSGFTCTPLRVLYSHRHNPEVLSIVSSYLGILWLFPSSNPKRVPLHVAIC